MADYYYFSSKTLALRLLVRSEGTEAGDRVIGADYAVIDGMATTGRGETRGET